MGHPDLPRQYDDGDLIDVNQAPPGALSMPLGATGNFVDRVCGFA